MAFLVQMNKMVALMAKKMAVRNQPSSKNLSNSLAVSVNRNLPLIKRVFLSLLAIILIAGFVTIVRQYKFTNTQVWPVETLAIISDGEQVSKRDLANIIRQLGQQSLLSVDLERIQNKIQENPWAEKVELRKIWPDTLEIRVTERKAIAKINDWFLLDNQVLAKSSHSNIQSAQSSELASMTIADSVLNNLSRNQQLSKVVATALDIGLVLQRQQLKVDQFQISDIENWSVRMNNGMRITIGRKHQLERIEQLVRVYAAIIDKNNIEKIDLRYNNGFAITLSADANIHQENT